MLTKRQLEMALPVLRGAARLYVRRQDPVVDEDDVAQEAALRAWQHRRQFRSESRPECWLWRIAVNTARDLARRRFGSHGDRPQPLPLDAPLEGGDPFSVAGQGENPEELAGRAEQLRLLQTAIAQAPPEMAEALLLRYFDGLEVREISKRLGACENTIKVRLLRGRCWLRRYLGRAHAI